MVVSGHQPVYLPWLGFFHKLYLSDVFVFMDTVQYLNKDWNNRNKIRTPHGSMWLTVPIDKKKSGKNLDEIYIKQGDFNDKNFWQNQHFVNLKQNYKKAPCIDQYIGELEEMYLNKKWEKLIDLCWEQFQLFRKWLGLTEKKVVRMSEYEFEGYKDDLVLDHCLKLGGDQVVFGQNGKDYVDTDKFSNRGIKVYFQEYIHPEYKQRFTPFMPYLSVIDLLFNYGDDSLEIIKQGNDTRKDLEQYFAEIKQ